MRRRRKVFGNVWFGSRSKQLLDRLAAIAQDRVIECPRTGQDESIWIGPVGDRLSNAPWAVGAQGAPEQALFGVEIADSSIHGPTPESPRPPAPRGLRRSGGWRG